MGLHDGVAEAVDIVVVVADIVVVVADIVVADIVVVVADIVVVVVGEFAAVDTVDGVVVEVDIDSMVHGDSFVVGVVLEVALLV